MRIHSVDIRNFRCYEQKRFDFDERLSVVVGNNTAGKTALLEAVQIGLGAYLQSLVSIPKGRNYHRNFSKEDVFKRYNRVKKDFFENPERMRIEMSGDFLEASAEYAGGYVRTPLSWWREYTGSNTTHTKQCAGQLIEITERMESLRRSEQEDVNALYPVVLSFGANRLDNQYRTAAKTKERSSRIEKAYKGCLAETTDFKSAFDWLYHYDDNIKMGKEFDGTRDAFLEALQTALPALSDIIVSAKDKELFARVAVTGMEPQYQAYRFMSDGFKSVINIVSEIAYRSILLNGHLGTEAVRRTPGIVLIDEVELYLHPRWQRHFLQELTEAFPLMQFIVTSHSPFIIQSVRNKNLITLDGVADTTDPLRRSLEEIAAREMNMDGVLRSKRYQEMLEKAETYYQLVKQGREKEQTTLELGRQLDLMEAEFSDEPAYVALLRAERGGL